MNLRFGQKLLQRFTWRKNDEAGLCVGDFSLQESCFISPRKRAEKPPKSQTQKSTGRGREDREEVQEDEKREKLWNSTVSTLLRGGWKKDFFIVLFFFEEGEASEGRNEEEDSNRQTQCHQRVKLIIDDHLEKVIEEMRSWNRTTWHPGIGRVQIERENLNLEEPKRMNEYGISVRR